MREMHGENKQQCDIQILELHQKHEYTLMYMEGL